MRSATEVLRTRHRLIRLIAAYKLVKVVLLLAASVAAWRLVNPNVGTALRAWADALPLGFTTHLLRESLNWMTGVPAHRWVQVGFISLGYAALFTAEGIGLWRERLWAEYLTIFTTASLLPFEAVEVVQRTTWLRAGVLVANLIVVAYLVRCVQITRRQHAERQPLRESVPLGPPAAPAKAEPEASKPRPRAGASGPLSEGQL